MSNLTIAGMSIVLCTAATAAAAADLNATQPLLCAARSAAVCEEHGACATTLPEAVNLPAFWKIDPAAKTVESRRADSDTPRTSQISKVALSGGWLILQGDEDGLGWTVTIAADTGKMILSGGRDIGFVVFGACTAL